MTLIHEFAPAKLNLYLHVTGRRADGYHDLDSLVAFANIGDEIQLKPAVDFTFVIDGKQAAALANDNHENNLVVKAARSLAELTGKILDAHLKLVKKLPIASGIGGGSSDAAAALRALAQHWGLAKDDPRLVQAALKHGQDVPVCLKIENLYMTATGTEKAPILPRADIVMINPGKALPTPLVYKEFREHNDSFSPLARLTQTPQNVAELVDILKLRGNDLYAAACRLMPEITDMIDVLCTSDQCLLARMSGSGATCFGIYPDAKSASLAAQKIKKANPGWWVEAGVINGK